MNITLHYFFLLLYYLSIIWLATNQELIAYARVWIPLLFYRKLHNNVYKKLQKRLFVIKKYWIISSFWSVYCRF